MRLFLKYESVRATKGGAVHCFRNELRPLFRYFSLRAPYMARRSINLSRSSLPKRRCELGLCE